MLDYKFYSVMVMFSYVKLLQKLRSYGINQKLINWIQDYLTNREMAVRVNGKLSNFAEVMLY